MKKNLRKILISILTAACAFAIIWGGANKKPLPRDPKHPDKGDDRMSLSCNFPVEDNAENIFG